MKLSRIEAEIAPVILERGEAYRQAGRIQYIEEEHPGVYETQVDGSDDYYIEIHLESKNEVTFTSCDCPFEGPICKHVAAVLLELEEREKRNSSYSSYWSETAAQLRHDVIRQWDGEEAAAAFMQSLLHMSGFRKRAIEQALANQQWDEARMLIEEGEFADTKAGYPGLVDNW